MNPLHEITARRVIADLAKDRGLAILHVAKYDLPKPGVMDPYSEQVEIFSVDTRKNDLLTKNPLGRTLDKLTKETRGWNLRDNAQQMAIGFCSLVLANDGSLGHIPMVDIDLPPTAENLSRTRDEANQILPPYTEVYVLESSPTKNDSRSEGGMHLYAHARLLPTLKDLGDIQGGFTGSDPQHVERTQDRGYAIMRVDSFPPLKPAEPRVVAYFQTTRTQK